MKKVLHIVCLILVVILTMATECHKEYDNPTDPRTPTYIYPLDKSTGQSLTPTLIWNPYWDQYAGEGYLWYNVFIEKGVETKFQDLDISDTTSVCTTELEPLTEYTWHVTFYNDVSTTVITGPDWTFTTGTGFNNPPVAPFDPDPEDRASGTDLNPQLGWDCYDLDGDDLTYDIWLDPALGEKVLAGEEVAVKHFDLEGLDPDKTYWWQVIAFDSHGDSTAGPWWGFKTIPASNKPPVEPWGEYPSDDETDLPIDLTLSWSCTDPEDGPLAYDVAIGPAGGTLTVIASGISADFLLVTDLDPMTEYEWLVYATDDHDQTTPGPIWSFTTGDGTPSEDVYALMTLRRNITYSDLDGIIRVDNIQARFDSLYAPDGPIYPMQPGGVGCGSFGLVWQSGSNIYEYSDYMAGYFLDPGTTYTFSVSEGGGVPSLISDPIAFPICAPYITSPAAWTGVSLDGFELEWHTFCSGTIDITIMDLNSPDSTGVYIRTDDDGAYTFTADDLSPLSPEIYQLQIVLITENSQTISATGYDPRSRIRARTLSTQIVVKE